jgi:hypothetical protein
MLALRTILLAAALSLPGYGVDPCSNAAVTGPYGLHLSGTSSTISGSPTPFASLSRLAFDGEGHVSGYSSVNFNGLLLGNPVTGTYDVKPDCTASFSLQDDSGGFQHFAGKLATVGSAIDLRQTDPGTGGHGKMARTSDACSAADLRPSYTFALSGTATPLAAPDVSGNISAKGVLRVDGATGFTLIQTFDGHDVTTGGTWSVESDCTVHFDLALPVKNAKQPVPMKLRGILVNQGLQIFAMQTDPATVVLARFTAN